MKKKIKDLTKEERDAICKKQRGCMSCPIHATLYVCGYVESNDDCIREMEVEIKEEPL